MKRRATVSWTSCSAAISVQSVSQNVQIDRLQFSIFWLLTYRTHFAAKVSLCIAPSCVRAKKKPSWAPRSWGITWPKLRYKIGSVGHSCSSELLRELIIRINIIGTVISLVLLDLLVCVCVRAVNICERSEKRRVVSSFGWMNEAFAFVVPINDLGRLEESKVIIQLQFCRDFNMFQEISTVPCTFFGCNISLWSLCRSCSQRERCGCSASLDGILLCIKEEGFVRSNQLQWIKRIPSFQPTNSTPIADDKDVMQTFAVILEAGRPWFPLSSSCETSNCSQQMSRR